MVKDVTGTFGKPRVHTDHWVAARISSKFLLGLRPPAIPDLVLVKDAP